MSKNYRAAGEQMSAFAAARLRESGLYDIREADPYHVLAEKQDGTHIDLVLHSQNIPEKELKKRRSSNRARGVYTAHMFYAGRVPGSHEEDSEFLKKLHASRQMRDTVLRRYTSEEISRMVELRDNERYVLERCGIDRFYRDIFKDGSRRLVYYSPAGQSSEGILVVSMLPVTSDYEYVGTGHRASGHVPAAKVLEGRKLTDTVKVSVDPVHFALDPNTYHAVLTSDTSKYPARRAVAPDISLPQKPTIRKNGKIPKNAVTQGQLELF